MPFKMTAQQYSARDRPRQLSLPEKFPRQLRTQWRCCNRRARWQECWKHRIEKEEQALASQLEKAIENARPPSQQSLQQAGLAAATAGGGADDDDARSVCSRASSKASSKLSSRMSSRHSDISSRITSSTTTARKLAQLEAQLAREVSRRKELETLLEEQQAEVESR